MVAPPVKRLLSLFASAWIEQGLGEIHLMKLLFPSDFWFGAEIIPGSRADRTRNY
jgi:hypothetical protein